MSILSALKAPQTFVGEVTSEMNAVGLLLIHMHLVLCCKTTAVQLEEYILAFLTHSTILSNGIRKSFLKAKRFGEIWSSHREVQGVGRADEG